MVLNFNSAWRFSSPGPVDSRAVNCFSNLIGRIAAQGDRQVILEHFKTYFANAGGLTSNWSSSASWAKSDLENYMTRAAENAPLFIEAFYDGCAALQGERSDIAVPDVAMMNHVLCENEVMFEIRPPDLAVRGPHLPVAVSHQAPSLDEQAQELIELSQKQSEQLLAEGRPRQAVQEILWLLETVATAFQGVDVAGGTIQGKYFNKIVDDLRRHNRGGTLDQVLGWVVTLHGYLSSPTGGGVRHGTNLNSGVAVQANEAQLYCNLIRSYISFLLAEHGRLIAADGRRRDGSG